MRIKKVRVLCGGCFNQLHSGHVYFMKSAKSLGDYLVVIISNDELNRKKYGKKAVPAVKRKRDVEKLKIADMVVVGISPADYKKVINKFKPDIIALGYDQNIELGATGFKVIRVPRQTSTMQSVAKRRQAIKLRHAILPLSRKKK